MKKNILVLFGGKSFEHDISILTGVMTANSIDKVYCVIPIYIDKAGVWWTGENLLNVNFYKKINYKKLRRVTLVSGSDNLFYLKGKKFYNPQKIYCAINCTHGLFGEDGTLAGLIQSHFIPLASPDVFASSFAMDKEKTKIILKGIGVEVLKYEAVHQLDFNNDKNKIFDLCEKLSYPLICKPARLGSSIGIKVANNQEELKKGLEFGFKFDDKIIVEHKLDNIIEINCACYKIGNNIHVSQCEKPKTQGEFLSFDEKYKRESIREFPAKISEKISQKIQKITKKIYQKLSFSGIIRIDFLVKNDVVFVNELNTIPGSLAYYLFCDTFADFSKILSNLIENAFLEYQQADKDFNFNSGVLDSNYVNKK